MMKLENATFAAEIDERCGGLRSFVLKADPDRMNWVEGRATWGLVRALCGHDEPELIPFLSVRETGEKIISEYGNDELHLTVERSVSAGGGLREEYILSSLDGAPFFFNRGDLGIYATFNDSYADAETCLKQRCHAHIWCGEEVSYVRALKMGFADWNAGLILRHGSLNAYRVERIASEISNDRGDFLLHVTPAVIEPGEELRIEWELFAYPGDGFEQTLLEKYPGVVLIESENDTVFPGEPFRLTARCASPIGEAAVLLNGEPLPVRISGSTLQVGYLPETCGEYVFHFEIDGVHTVARCRRVEDRETILRRRIDFLIHCQQYRKPGSPLDGAFLIYDNEERRPFFKKNVGDHNAGRERLGMGLLIARYLQTHHVPEYFDALERFEAFLLRELFDTETGEVFNTIGRTMWTRLYNAPWMITFFLELFRLKKESRYLDYIFRAARRYYEGGGARFYPNGAQFSALIPVFRANNREEEADLLTRYCREHVENIARNGGNYPAHEVRFEQTIAAPASDLTAEYALVFDAPEIVESCALHTRILSRFDGRQPDYRLNGIPIRHWDGYWFGKLRLYGDTFPHYWSVLSARAYLRCELLTGDRTRHNRAERCLRNTLCLFHEDGSASCAYVYCHSVVMIDDEGRREPRRFGERNDPWANDQDFALYFHLCLQTPG